MPSTMPFNIHHYQYEAQVGVLRIKAFVAAIASIITLSPIMALSALEANQTSSAQLQGKSLREWDRVSKSGMFAESAK